MTLIELKHKQTGFTIVELMISMAVLSVLLVVVSMAMLSIGNLYYKGINQAKVQNSVRSISDEVSSHLQLMSGNSGIGPFERSIGSPIKAYCIGDVRYTYIVGIQQGNEATLDNPQIAHVLWRDNPTGSCQDNIPDLNNPATDGVDLVPANSRLTEFNVSQVSPGVYTVNVGIAYGENDLLTATQGADVRCKGDANTKFCASAYLNTKVARRLQ